VTTQEPPLVPPADLLAETANASAIRLGKRPQRPVDGKHRKVVAYCAPDVTISETAVLLKELADELDPRDDPDPSKREPDLSRAQGSRDRTSDAESSAA
jgi:hypothetical protein